MTKNPKNAILLGPLMGVILLIAGSIIMSTLGREMIQSDSGESGQKPLVSCTIEVTPYPIMSDSQGVVVLAGAIPFGVYSSDATMSNLLPRLEQLNAESRFQYPEDLIMSEFLAKKEGDLDAVTALYEPGDSAEQAQEQFAEIDKIADELKTDIDLQFVNKSLFGPYVSIAYNILGKNGEEFFWVETAKLVGDRYYLTYDIDNLHIFTLLASSHPWSYKKTEFMEPDVEDMRQITVSADTEGEVSGKVVVSVDGDIPESAEHYLNIYVDLHLYPEDFLLFGSDSDTQAVDDREVEFMRRVVQTYREGDDAEVLALWDHKMRETIERDMQYGEGSKTGSLRALYRNATEIFVIAKVPTPDVAVLYWRASFGGGKQTPISTFFITESEDGYLMTGSLEDKYYAGQILQNTVMSRAIELWLKKRE